MASGPLVVLARLKGDGRWQVRAGDGVVPLDGLGLDLGRPAKVVFDAASRSIRLETNRRLVRSDSGDAQAPTKPFTLTTGAGALELVCFCVADEHHAAPTPNIMKAIEAVRAGDEDTTRVVLGDVLEEAGAIAEAEYVRLELDLQRQSPSGAGFIEGVRRLRTLSSVVGPTFRYLVGRDIAGCSGVRWAFRCPMTWNELTPTNIGSERVCQTCRQLVVQVETETDARKLAGDGVCTSMAALEVDWVGDVSFDPDEAQSAPAPRPTWVGSVAVRVPATPPRPTPPVTASESRKKAWWNDCSASDFAETKTGAPGGAPARLPDSAHFRSRSWRSRWSASGPAAAWRWG